MPNWTSNRVHVSTNTGNRKELERFKNYVVRGISRMDEDTVFSFNSILPMPKELEGTESMNGNDQDDPVLVKKYGADNWYLWRIKNWGTKWEGFEVTLREKDSYFDEELTYRFRTAWSPPQGIMMALFEEFPDLDIKWIFVNEGQFELPGLVAKGTSFGKELFVIDPARLEGEEHPYYKQLEGIWGPICDKD